jgi:1-aminocyclopropane-1-carboxylate deaminase
MPENISDQINLENAVLSEVFFPEEFNGIRVLMKRIDLIHPFISGNKWFKLKYNLEKARREGYGTLLTFGGAYSNHIHATAAAGKIFGFKTIGLIRGEEHLPLNPTLKFAAEQGMKIIYVGRAEYRNKHLPSFQEKLIDRFGKIYIIPEGGTNLPAVKGCCEIPSLIEREYDYLCTPCGTAGTISGLIAGLNGNKKILGFPVLRGAQFLLNQTEERVYGYCGARYSNWSMIFDYHFGGYARIRRDLLEFIRIFEECNRIPLDPVYTGKMMFGIFDLLRNGYFSRGDTIVALHTGGLQGIEGMRAKMEAV